MLVKEQSKKRLLLLLASGFSLCLKGYLCGGLIGGLFEVINQQMIDFKA